MDSDEIDSSFGSTVGATPKYTSEAFLIGEIDKLEDTGQTVYSQRLQATAELYKCNEQKFAELFPVFQNYDIISGHPSLSAGQIRNKDDSGIGTATLIGIQEVEGKIRVLGVTAAHNFLRIDKSQGVMWPEKFYGRKFTLGSMIHPASKDEYFTLGETSIDKIMVQKNPEKDICLFEGVFTYNPSLFEENEQFIANFKSIPLIVETSITEPEKWDSSIYHYPLGKKDQRNNLGSAFGIGKHTMESLFGSSGAALFTPDGRIFGIHTGVDYGDLIFNKIAEYDGTKDIPIAKYNAFELFSMVEYNQLVNGIDLYGGGHSKDFIMKLSKLAEKISNGN